MIQPEDFGAVGNGVADDTGAIQAALNCGGRIALASGRAYMISSRLTVPTGSGLIGDGTPLLIMGSGPGQFDNALGGSEHRFDANAIGIGVDGASGVRLQGFRIKYQRQVEDRWVNAIGIRNSIDVKVRDIEA